ncbi:MAG TPA: type IX secretion system membrane protein PorP/SprF [Bacteroidia bacterium]|nr:type IX secretion system membrane protein PorP/SprF [Bacteroidia bacterium]MBP7714123.1 type IX secretion system membrane protein PorP/SprF [Bacteroidia bacterium]MBP8669410.1 type IX secretion system membrane protein PorP/SprF [Bacteroidia bacterium]HOZ82522.1 type IX secretion system membrane protein PorP/SprF [Bacteroidia bacterium]HOZ90783.1 type IX secretion system membrane protein PorP/SprF [Bacteroidia bacterium]
MKKLYSLIITLFMSGWLFGQQAPMTTQYMFNTLLINPAYAGSKPFTSATMMVRKQWAGFKGSPTTETASIHGALEDKNVGLGLYISNDHAGITNRTELFGSYSYTIEYGESKLAFGLQAGLSYLKSTLSDLVYNDNNDPVYDKNTVNNVLPNFGAGLYYHTDLFYAGISAPLLLSYDPLKTLSVEMTDVHHIRRHYFLTTGYVFSLSEQVKLKPSVLLKYVNGAPLQYDINANLLLNNIIWIGTSYRSNDALAIIGEYQLSKKLRIGYSFDYSLTILRNHSAGSHEFMLGYDFGYNVPKIKTPRYF